MSQQQQNEQPINDSNKETINVYEKSQGVIFTEDSIGDVSAEIVKMSNSSAKNITAKNSVRIDQSLVKNIITSDCDATQTVSFKVSAEKARYDNAVVFLNDSAETVCDRTFNAVSVSETVHASRQNSLVSFASDTHAGSIQSVVFIGKKVHGEVTTLLDARKAAIFGACMGAIYFLLRAMFKQR